MCGVLIALVLVLAALGVAVEYWPITLAVLTTWALTTGLRAHARRTAEARQRAHEHAVVEHRAATAYWRAQAAEVDTPVARQVAEGLAAYNEARLRELSEFRPATESAAPPVGVPDALPETDTVTSPRLGRSPSPRQRPTDCVSPAGARDLPAAG